MIAAAGLGIDYDPDAVYTPDQTGILMKVMPADPDRVVVLNAVWQGDNITLPAGQCMVQVRGRGLPGQPLDVDDLLDPIKTILHGSTNLIFGGVTVIQMNRKVRAPLGMDASKRWEIADQYYLDVSTQPTAPQPTSGSW
jgi:hypothetical protein